jgi:pyruvate/2-oxoglutarate/acetoin dehydrogenase E1 component
VREITYVEALREALREEMARDDRVFLMGMDIGEYGGIFGVTMGLKDEFGKARVRNTPCSEAAIVGTAVGAAMMGMRPIVEIMFIDWIGLALDQIMNNMASLRYAYGGEITVPMVLRVQGGLELGTTARVHTGMQNAWLAYIPGLKVVMPSTPYDAKGLLKAAIRDENPVVFIEHKGLYKTKGSVPNEEYTLEIGCAEVKRKGTHITIVGTSKMVLEALSAAEILSKEGIEAEVVDVRCLRPLDMDTIVQSVKKTRKAVVVGEGWKTYGIEAEIVAGLNEKAFEYLDAPVGRIGLTDIYAPFALSLEKMVLPNLGKIVEAVRSVVKLGYLWRDDVRLS